MTRAGWVPSDSERCWTRIVAAWPVSDGEAVVLASLHDAVGWGAGRQPER